MRRNSAILLIGLIVLCVSASAVGGADSSQVKAITQAVKLYQGVLSFPPPMWVNDVKDLGNSEFFRNQQNNLFAIEQIPKGQTFERWTNLYGVYKIQPTEAHAYAVCEKIVNDLDKGGFFHE